LTRVLRKRGMGPGVGSSGGQQVAGAARKSKAVMWRVRIRLKAAYHKFPGMGYALAVAACGGLVLAGVLHWEWGIFVLWPALNGACHFAAPREVWGGRAYWTLAAMWFGAAALGMLAHWEALEPQTPWFSLGRYGLFAGAHLMSMAAPLTGRPDFSSREEPKLRRVWVRILLGVVLVAHAAVVVLIVYLTPWQLAMAPRYPGVVARKLIALPGDDLPLFLAWSPDSRYVAMSRRPGEVWLLDVEEGKEARVAEGVRMSRQPWLCSGEGFAVVPSECDENGVIVLSREGVMRRRIMEERRVSMVVASPVREELAITTGGGVSIVGADGSDERVLVDDASLGLIGSWSPDGTRVLMQRMSEQEGKRRHVTSILVGDMGGTTSHVIDERCFPTELAWASGDRLAVIDCKEMGGETDFRAFLSWPTEDVTLRLIDVEGREVWRLTTRAGVGGMMATLAPRPGVDMVAFDPFYFVPFVPEPFLGLFAVGTTTRHLWRVSGGPSVTGVMAWSPDGRQLAVAGEQWDLGFGVSQNQLARRGGIWVISGW
jgi:hypothetical protein